MEKNQKQSKANKISENRKSDTGHNPAIGITASLLAVMLLITSCGSAPANPASSVASSADATVTVSTTVATSSDATVAASTTDSASTSASNGLLEFTADQLATNDGQNGNPSYIAVDGNVYDVSGVGVWKNGSHWGKYFAGRDLSKEILLSPHGKSKLEEVPLVGTLKE